MNTLKNTPNRLHSHQFLRKLRYSLPVAFLAAFLLTACSGSNTVSETSDPEDSASYSSEGSNSAGTEVDSSDESDSSEGSDDSDTSDDDTDLDLPEVTGETTYSDGVVEYEYDEEDATPLDEIQGEGTTDSQVPDTSNAISAGVGEVCVITDSSGAEIGTLTIDSVYTTDERDENNPSDPDNVLVVNYTYSSTSEDPVLLDDIFFKLVVNNAVKDPYYAAFLTNADLCESGETVSAQMGFEVGKHFKKGKLVFSAEEGWTEYTFILKI